LQACCASLIISSPLQFLFRRFRLRGVTTLVQIAPFKGLQYNPDKTSFISRVVAPPYDLIEPELAEELRQRDPHNVIRLILGKEGPQGRPAEEYRQAALTFAAWRREEVIIPVPEPSVYVCEQAFELHGARHVRHGLICAMLLEGFGSGQVLPHERTLAGPKADRLRLMEACEAGLSQVFGVFSDPEGQADAMLRNMRAADPLYEFRDTDNVAYRVWRVTEEAYIRHLASLLEKEVMLIADGHHRYETALRYRDRHRPEGVPTGSVPADFLPIYCVSVKSAGLQILPTHWLAKAVPPFDAEVFILALERHFELERREFQGPEGLREALRLWPEREDSIACHLRQQRLYILSPKSPQVLEDILPDRSPVWRCLAVTVLHYAVLRPFFGIPADGEGSEPRLAFSQDIEKMYWSVESQRFDAGFFLPPVRPATVETIARVGERMPPKSTFFYPKIVSGLVFYPLDPQSTCPRIATY
jgi:uncharacterized protein (DUF1015 family)